MQLREWQGLSGPVGVPEAMAVAPARHWAGWLDGYRTAASAGAPLRGRCVTAKEAHRPFESQRLVVLRRSRRSEAVLQFLEGHLQRLALHRLAGPRQCVHPVLVERLQFFGIAVQ